MVHSWTEDRRLHLLEHSRPKDDTDPKALACYGLLLRSVETEEQVWLRFVAGRPVSAITIQYLEWCCATLAAQGKCALLLVWDNASWHQSQIVRDWIRQHNRQVKRERKGVRLVVCALPVKSPWLNPIEPKWVHGKRRVVEPDRLLTAHELAERVYATFDCPSEPFLSIPKKVS